MPFFLIFFLLPILRRNELAFQPFSPTFLTTKISKPFEEEEKKVTNEPSHQQKVISRFCARVQYVYSSEFGNIPPFWRERKRRLLPLIMEAERSERLQSASLVKHQKTGRGPFQTLPGFLPSFGAEIKRASRAWEILLKLGRPQRCTILLVINLDQNVISRYMQ